MQVTSVEQGNVDQAQQTAQQAQRVLSEGGLVVFPTETVYGIAASALSNDGYAALRRFKDRHDSQPFTIHLPSADAARQYVDPSDRLVQRLIGKVLPGPVTLVIEGPDEVIASTLSSLGLPAEARDRLYHNNTVGLRCPDHPLAQQVLAGTAPIVASSANRRNRPPPQDADAAAEAVGDAAAMIIDGGPCRYSKSSTIVRVGADRDGRDRLSVMRDGVYDERFIRKLMHWTLLVVCSGNTCRSPMAQALAQQALAERHGVAAGDLPGRGISVVSAGAFAAPGQPASDHAIEAMRQLDVDLTRHRSQPLAIELIHEADVIYGMTAVHRDAVIAMVASAAERTFSLDPSGDIEDPIASDAKGYQRCAERIRRCLALRLQEHQP